MEPENVCPISKVMLTFANELMQQVEVLTKELGAKDKVLKWTREENDELRGWLKIPKFYRKLPHTFLP